MFLLLTSKYFLPFSRVSIVDFEQVTVSWVIFNDILLGSILGPFVFNISLSNLFRLLNDVTTASYHDDTTPYSFNNRFSNK